MRFGRGRPSEGHLHAEVERAASAGRSGAMTTNVTDISATEMDTGVTGAVWSRACAALKGELGEDTFGSWIAPARLKCSRAGHASAEFHGVHRHLCTSCDDRILLKLAIHLIASSSSI